MQTQIYKKKISYFILTIIVITILILSLNYFQDAGNQFFHKKSFEKNVVNALLNNFNVMICTNYDDRSLKKAEINEINSKPKLLILGSSRTLSINSDLVEEQKFYNASVTGARLEDDIAIYYLFQKKGWNPNVIIISLDPWILYRNNDKMLWRLTFASEYKLAKEKFLNSHESTVFLNEIRGVFDKYTGLFSAYYLVASIEKFRFIHDLLKKKFPHSGYIINPNNNDYQLLSSCNILLPNGTKKLSKEEEASLQLTNKDLKIDELTNIPLDSKIDSEYTKTFQAFINYLLSRNIKIIFYFPPYENTTYSALNKTPIKKILNTTEQYFLSIAKNNKIKIIGSYNPEKINLSSNDFIDSIHLKQLGLRKVFLTRYEINGDDNAKHEI